MTSRCEATNLPVCQISGSINNMIAPIINKKRWYTLSYCERMGHIGSEIARARVFEDRKDLEYRNRSLERALGLIDITIEGLSIDERRLELYYLRKLVADRYTNASIYNVSLKDLDDCFLDFALVARKDK